MNYFCDSLDKLKELTPEDLYSFFHRTQDRVTRPQSQSFLKTLLIKAELENLWEVSGLKNPEIPIHFSEQITNKVLSSPPQSTLYFNGCLSQTTNIQEVLSVINQTKHSSVLIHDTPDKRFFSYDSLPKVDFFTSRNQNNKNRRDDSSISTFTEVLNWSKKFGWLSTEDSYLDFTYHTPEQKEGLIKMELALDLIYSHYLGKTSQFEQVKSELLNWYNHPEARLTVKGCSRWVKLTRMNHT